jgi:hypothetical protein
VYQVPDVINTPLSETLMVRIVLHLTQTSYRARVLTIDDLQRATAEADASLTSLGLTATERVGTCIEVSSYADRSSRRGTTMATFAEMQRTRRGWRLNCIGRRANRAALTPWFVTAPPADTALARAATRVLRRGTNGQGRL